MRILIATEVSPGNVNGVTTTLRYMLRHFGPEHRVLLCGPRGIRPAAAELSLPGVETRLFPSLGLPGYPEVQTAWASAAVLRSVIRSFRADIVHLMDPVILASRMGHLAAGDRLPVIASFHTHLPAYSEFYGLRPLTGLAWAACRRGYRAASVVLAPSGTIANELSARGIGPVRVWRRGVDTELFHPKRRDESLRRRLCGGRPRLALFVGRLAREKNLPLLVRYMATRKRWRLALVGDGPMARRLAAQSGEASPILVGELDGLQLAAHLASADAFVFTSQTETYGQALVEAMASGVPVVAGRHPVLEETVGGSEGASFFDPGDEADFSRALEASIQPLERNRLVAHGLRVSHGRSWARAVAELRGHYTASGGL